MTVKGRMTPFRSCLAALAAAACAAVLVAGCGGSSEATAKDTSSGPIVKSLDKVTDTGGSTEIKTGEFPNGADTDEVSVSGTKPVKPCRLVSAAEADRILGGNVHKQEHLQGPTCVFIGSGRQVSMVVMELPLQPLVDGARSSQALRIAGHKAYCLRYETSSVVAAVSHGRVLQVTGPCPAGVRFAAAALPRIPS